MTVEPSASGRSSGRWVVLALLTVTTTINLMDRQLPFIMAEPIKHEFALNDAELGLLGGFAFSLVYAFGALPLARAADRWSRKWVLAGCLFVWSLGTAIGGLVRTFPQLMATRAGVAIGEAGASPCAQSMISDLFPEGSRALAQAINAAGIGIGVMLGMGLGGILLEYLPWRTVLVLAAIPGLLLALTFAFLVRERPRTHLQKQLAPIDLTTALAMLRRRRAFLWLTLGATLSVFATSGGAVFAPSFFMRAHGLSIDDAGVLFGLLIGCGGTAGGIAAGVLADRAALRDPRWLLWIPAIGLLVEAPLYCSSWLVGSFWLASACQLFAWMLGGGYLSLSYTATQAIAPERMRTFAAAVFQLVVNILGNVLGPLCAGAISDRMHFLLVGNALGWALAVCGSCLLLGAFAYYRAGAWLPADLAIQAQPRDAIVLPVVPDEIVSEAIK